MYSARIKTKKNIAKLYHVCCTLTITKKMADVHSTRMHCGRKSFQKANGHLLRTDIQNFSSGDFVSSLFSHLLFMLAMHSGKM